MSMILYRIPTQAQQETGVFSVMGQDLKTGELCAEIRIAPGLMFDLPDSAFLFSFSIPSGNLKNQLQMLHDKHGTQLWFLIEPLRHLFCLPCPDATGQKLTAAQSLALQAGAYVYDSPDFLCKYCVISSPGELLIHLFDTDDTIEQKIKLAANIGIDNIIYIM